MNSWNGKNIHFVGIKGIGMLGLAQLLEHEGAHISGSDTTEEFPSDIVLKNVGIHVKEFSRENIGGNIDLLVYSSAYPPSHPEREEARTRSIPELSYAEALEKYGENKKVIVITGTHGKTTTTALIAEIMRTGGLAPTALVGGIVRNWQNSILLPNLAVGPLSEEKTEYLVVEGDEYQEKFARFTPFGLVITSFDYDHSDYYPTPESYREAFQKYITTHRAVPVIAKEDAEKLSLSVFSAPVDEDEKIFSAARFALPGEAYRKDALLAICFTRLLGVASETILRALAGFKGVERRLDRLSPAHGEVIILNDYAHHPDEIQATLQAVKEQYRGRKIIAIFQPHTYTRTKAFLEAFSKAFESADEVFFDEIYGSAREEKGEITARDLMEKTRAHHAKAALLKEAWPEDFLRKVRSEKNALVITMGAGDIWQKARTLSRAFFGEKEKFD